MDAGQGVTFDPRWEELHACKRWGVWPSEHLVRFVCGREWPSDPFAIDLGAGAGAQTRFLLEHGFDVAAVEASPSACGRLEQYRNVDDRLAIVKCDVAALDQSESALGEFDLVVDVCTLQHLPLETVRETIQKARQWLAPGGWFFSLMAGPGHTLITSQPMLRVINLPDVTRLFAGYRATIDVTQTETGEMRTHHWIIQAQVMK